MQENINWSKISSLMKIGLLGAFIILIGDFLIGWGVKDLSLPGIEGQISQYLTISDSRFFWSSILGVIGVPVAAVGHFGIYRLLKPYSKKYAVVCNRRLGIFSFGGAGVHLSSVAAGFFYKYMATASPDMALASSIKYFCYFPYLFV